MKDTFSLWFIGLAAMQGLASAQQPTTAVATRLPEITVVAEKVPAAAQAVPVSVTAVTREMLADDDARTVKDAAIFAPNVFMNEFTARKLSNPYFRGIGSSPSNPGVTTYIDDVPQLNANSSSLELVDVDQVEFVRGSQGTLYGRNTVGGLINVTSRQPSLTAWHSAAEGSLGNYNLRDGRVSTGGPLVPEKLGLGLAGGLVDRDGYTRNDFTGHRLDSREDYFGRAQLLWKPSSDWEVRLSVAGEHDNDGDYALGDLARIRANPHHVSRDFEGYTHRDIVAPTLRVEHKGEVVDFTMITGLVHWQTEDLTDLDYTADSTRYSTRLNSEKETQFTEELRFASAKDAPLVLNDALKLKWQTGLFVFSQDYQQDAFNNMTSTFGPLPMMPPGVRYGYQENAGLQDLGVGLNGQTTLTAWNKLDFTVGARVDWERKEADLQSTTTIPQYGVVHPSALTAHKDYSEVSPHFGLDYHLTTEATAYATATRGYKAGGFNPSAPAGSVEYGPEHTWDYELGVKTSWLDHRLLANLALFYINWQDIQVNQPNPSSPGAFYINNAGEATSKGVEFELTARPLDGLDLFGGVGLTDARFGSGSTEGGVDVSGNRLQYAPEFTANAGLQYSRALCQAATAYARAEVVSYGDYQYNSQNTASQSAYSLANFRLGVRGSRWFAEGWIRNAFDRNYVPIAFTYNSRTGLIGESGAPMTCGIRAGLNF